MVSIAGLVIADALGTRRGVQDADALNRIRIIGAFLGASPLGIIVSDAVAQREAENSGTVTTTTITTTTGATGTTGTQVQVPDIINMPIAGGETLLTSIGLQPQRQNVLSSKTARDVIIAQNPKGGETVPKGTVIILSVSQGVIVPNVQNLSLADATTQLQAIGLQVQSVNELSTTITRGAVIGQNPPPGSNVSSGSTVMLTVSLGGNVTVPDVSGKRATEAQARLQDADLPAKLMSEASGSINKGFVIRSDPPAGTEVALGTTVTLVVSTGQDFELPDVTGQLFEDGQKKLQRLKLQVKREDQNSDAVLKGFVIQQDPPAKTLVSPNSVVTLFISKGVPVIELPNVIGQRYSRARETLQNLDFIIKYEELSSTERKGIVIDQDPKAGEVAPESQVTLYVSKGRQEEVPQEFS